MTTGRTIFVLLLAAAVWARSDATDAKGGGSSVGHGGGFGGYHYRPISPAPRADQHVPQPRRPVFGPSAPASPFRPPTFRAPPRSSPSSPNRPDFKGHSVHDFRGGDFRQFDAADRNIWKSGHWHHGTYHGLYGWWWFIAGYWYWYDEPIYPYPDYVSDDVEPDGDGEIPPDATPPEGLTGSVYYYCGDPSGYYPYVAKCNVPWEPVPAAPSP